MDKHIILFFLLTIFFNIDASSDHITYENYIKRLKRGTEECQKSGIIQNTDGSIKLNIRFPQAIVSQDDQYLCTSHEVPFEGKESYLTKYLPHASMTSTHHMLVYGCEEPGSNKGVWECGSMGSVCGNGRSQIVYAWARNAPALTLPPNIGYRIGGNSKLKVLVVQMHYAHKLPTGKVDCSGFSAIVTQQPQKYYAGIYLLGALTITIPPHSNATSDVSCKDDIDSTLHVFAFRTHAHSTGKVITGYRKRGKNLSMIGKGNPQWPHAFYPRIGGSIDLNKGDELLARCVYESNRDITTRSGMTGSDEMCNFYMMYYTSNKDIPGMGLSCWGNRLRIPSQNFPPDANDLAPYPGFAGAVSTKAIESGEVVQPSVPEEHHHHHHESNHGDHDHESGQDDREHSLKVNFPEQVIKAQPELTAEPNWPSKSLKDRIGQVGGISVDTHGFVHVFHRADRIWGQQSFDFYNRFTQPHNPISLNTMFILDPILGDLAFEWGKDMFYMPHGITVDPHNRVWVTDVALHQVMMFPLYGATQPLLALGERLVPGSDSRHFCKPTKVAVDVDGSIYVADGYCNGRVVKFNANGTFVKSWGHVGFSTREGPRPPFYFAVAHSITFAGDKMQYVCVADRENGRIQCFTKDGKLLKVIENKKMMGKNIYALSYSNESGGILYVINGPSSPLVRSSVFVIQFDSGDVIGQWDPSPTLDLSHPHDIVAPPHQNQIFVGQLDGKKLYRFNVEYKNSTSARTASSDVGNQRKRPELSGVEVPEQIKSVLKGEVAPTKEDSLILDVDHTSLSIKPTVEDEKSDDGTWNIVLAAFLIAVPVLCVIIGVFIIRAQRRRYKSYQDLLKEDSHDSYHDKPQTKFNVGAFLGKSDPKRQGFEPVKTVTSDESESEDELYSNTMH